jgi:hypothetical protein
MTGLWIPGSEATMTWRMGQTPGAGVAPGPLDEEGGSPMDRRTLPRVFAAAVAIAIISPLFASDSNGCTRRSLQTKPFHPNLPAPTPVLHHD